MRLVEQEHIDGCGVACFAMLTGRTYSEALAVLNPGQESWTDQNRLIEALKQDGFKIGVRFATCIESLKTAVLVVRYRIGGCIYMHSVVWDAESRVVLDPYGTRPFKEYEDGLCLAYEVSPP